MATNPLPGHHAITPYLVADGAAAAIAFYIDAFGAEELYRLPMGERIGHAELRIADSRIMISDPFPETGVRDPAALGGTAVSLLLTVPDVDAAFARAIAAGAREERAVADQFYGDRSGTLVDPFGHRWMLATHIEDVSPEEMRRRMATM